MNALLTNWGRLLIPLLFAGSMGGLAFALLRALREALREYDDVYAHETAREFEDVFLFVPARRITEITLCAAAVIAFAGFFLFGNLSTPRGRLSGAVFGLAGAVLALQAPRGLLRLLQERRRRRFNNQLAEALPAMSNALRAGFSILQACESIVQEGANPIAQEFGVFLHQTRVGVRFEDALEEMGGRVNSEDLWLTIRAIEIARQTGGNLTTVLETIAATIRERLRIEERIRALTAQGRLQGWVVGFIPLLLLFALAALEPKMMGAFLASPIGWGLLGLVLVLEVTGALIIRKIVRIDV